ncbi:MAG: ATP phosphoribosyltransferase regulatory subunit [Gammaproteobacteria bacterium]
MSGSKYSDTNRWLLPDGIEEFLPPQAERRESLRSNLLALFQSWGYQLVAPPLIEYMESLLVGAGNDLEHETFRLIDQATGRLMGVRADMTPQVARIDAHRLNREVPTRLCYMGAVLRASQSGFTGSRSPFQIGAELYGHSGIESDLEVLHLMVKVLHAIGLKELYIDLGHVGIFRALAKGAGLNDDQVSVLFDALQRKAKPEISEFLSALDITENYHRCLVSLADLNGDIQILEVARELFVNTNQGVNEALDNLQAIADCAMKTLGSIPLNFDLAELRGYRYQTGVVFAAFVPGHGQEIARGGRYDDIGSAFGHARPATGFSSDLNTLIALTGPGKIRASMIAAPWSDDESLNVFIKELRSKGERVICMLPGQKGSAGDMGCDRLIEQKAGNWQIVEI